MSNVHDAEVMEHSSKNIYFLQLMYETVFSVKISIKELSDYIKYFGAI